MLGVSKSGLADVAELGHGNENYSPRNLSKGPKCFVASLQVTGPPSSAHCHSYLQGRES
jgi:hypothetical protein